MAKSPQLKLTDKGFKIKHLNRLLFLYFVRVRYYYDNKRI